MYLNYQVSFILISMYHAYNSLSKSTYQCIFNILVSTQPPAYSVYSKQVQVVLCDKIHADKQVNSAVNNVNKQKLRAFFSSTSRCKTPHSHFTHTKTKTNTFFRAKQTNTYRSLSPAHSHSHSLSPILPCATTGLTYTHFAVHDRTGSLVTRVNLKVFSPFNLSEREGGGYRVYDESIQGLFTNNQKQI